MSLQVQPSFSSQESFYVGMHLHDILYGVELCLYLKAMHVLLARKGAGRKSDVFYALFSTVMFVLITIWVAFMAFFGQATWLRDQTHPSRPIPYGYVDFTAAGTIIVQQMADGLMMYRCRIVWGNDSPGRVLVLPSVLWLATLALGVLVVCASSATKTDFFVGNAAKIGLAYYATSVCLSVTLTCLICYRLVRHAKNVKRYLGDHVASPYFAVVVLLVESVLPLTLSGIAFLISYGIGSQTEVAFATVYAVTTCVSTQMLILRVAEGNAWDQDAMKPPLSVMRSYPYLGDRSDAVVFQTQLGDDSKV